MTSSDAKDGSRWEQAGDGDAAAGGVAGWVRSLNSADATDKDIEIFLKPDTIPASLLPGRRKKFLVLRATPASDRCCLRLYPRCKPPTT